MKFFATVFAAMLASVTALTFDEKMRLMERAIPVGKLAKDRNLEEEFVIYPSQSISFSTCISLTTELDEKVQEMIAYYNDLMEYWTAGDIVSEADYVLFNICESSECTYEAEDNLYMVDLATYMGLTEVFPTQTQDYCEACQQAADWCTYGQYQVADNGGRFLQDAVQYVNCTTCETMGCLEEENNNNNQNAVTLEGTVEWVQNMAECAETGVQWNGLDLYSGFMCNEAGTGVELAIFMDDDCRVYSAKHSYTELNAYDAYAAASQEVVTYPFVHDISCAQDVEWASPEEAYNNDGQDQNQDDGEEEEANEFCRELVQSDLFTPLNDCGVAEEEDQNQDDNNNQNQYIFEYEYDLTEEQAEDAYSVCTVLNLVQTEGSSDSWKKNAAAKNTYKPEGSGHLYDYSARGSSSSGMEAGKIAGIIIGVIVAFALAMVALKYLNKTHDSRKEPLVSASEGGLA